MVADDDQHLLYLNGGPADNIKHKMARQMCIPHAATFHHRQLFDRFGHFDPSYRIAGDYDFLLRVLRQDDVGTMRMPGLIVTRMSVGGLSHTNVGLTRKESIDALRANGIKAFPLTQYKLLLNHVLSSSLKAVFRILLGPAWTALYHWRRCRRSKRLQAEIGAIMTESHAGA